MSAKPLYYLLGGVRILMDGVDAVAGPQSRFSCARCGKPIGLGREQEGGVPLGYWTCEHQPKPHEDLVAFLYTLLHDHLPAGEVERLVQKIEKYPRLSEYSNRHLAGYVRVLADRLLAAKERA